MSKGKGRKWGARLVDDLGFPDFEVRVGVWCMARSRDTDGSRSAFYCTRRARHNGRHAAGNGTRIVAVWGKRGRKGKR